LIIFTLLLCSLCLTACDDAGSTSIIGGADGPTSLFVAQKKESDMTMAQINKYLRQHYVNEHMLPSLDLMDIYFENPLVSGDRTLILDDSIENVLELMVYEYYQNKTAGDYQKVLDVILGEGLRIATKNEADNFANGLYYSRVFIDDIDLVDKDDLDEITESNKRNIVRMLTDLGTEEFAIVEAEAEIWHNEKSLAAGPQVGNGEVTRYYLLGKKDGAYKIVEVYWEGFMRD